LRCCARKPWRRLRRFPAGTPFQKGDTFLVSAGHATQSGPLKEKVQGGERYHCHVQGTKSTGPSADPEIIVTS
jgi:hypothetical protein